MTMLEIAGSILLGIGIIGMVGLIITSIFMLNPFRAINRRRDFFFILFTVAYSVGMFGSLAMSIIYEFIK